jgi:hypothetical protein
MIYQRKNATLSTQIKSLNSASVSASTNDRSHGTRSQKVLGGCMQQVPRF